MGKRWSPVTRIVWLVLIVGVAVQWWRWALLIAILSLAAVIPLALLAGHRERAASRQREDALDAIMATWREGQR